MDNQNTSNVNPPQEGVGQQPIPPKPSPMANIKQSWQKAKDSQLLKQASSKFEAFPPQQQKFLKIAGVAFVLLIVVLILGNIVKSLRFSKPVSTPTPAANVQTPLPTPESLGTPSVYATDSGVLKLESDVKALESKFGATDLDENNLKPPDINFYVKFTQ